MRKKMMKALKDLNGYIDNDREKLCDELHDIKLSHKRMERLLRRFIRISKSSYMDLNTERNVSLYYDLCKLYTDVERELSYPYFRVNWKTKGGKNV